MRVPPWASTSVMTGAKIQQFTSTAVVHPSLVSVAERLFFHVLDGVARISQNLDVTTSAEMLIFPQSNRRIFAARNWLALELDIGAANAAGSKLWATWRCETKDGITNHIVAAEHRGLVNECGQRGFGEL